MIYNREFWRALAMSAAAVSVFYFVVWFAAVVFNP